MWTGVRGAAVVPLVLLVLLVLPACNGDPADSASWRREILPLCIRCERLIRQAGDEGRLLKATCERWFGGHTVGRFEGKGVGESNKP